MNAQQTCHNFVDGIRIFSPKICINPYHSSTHRCVAILRNKINKNYNFATVKNSL